MEAMMTMVKLDVAEIERAYNFPTFENTKCEETHQHHYPPRTALQGEQQCAQSPHDTKSAARVGMMSTTLK